MAGPQIPLTGSIGVAGSAAVLGYTEITMTDADYTLSPEEAAANFLNIASSVDLTDTRSVVAPLNPGQQFTVVNNTGGAQDIQIIGDSGTGVTIANGGVAIVICDGINYSSAAGGGSGITQLTGDVLAGPGAGSQAATAVALHATSPDGSTCDITTENGSIGIVIDGSVPDNGTFTVEYDDNSSHYALTLSESDAYTLIQLALDDESFESASPTIRLNSNESVNPGIGFKIGEQTVSSTESYLLLVGGDGGVYVSADAVADTGLWLWDTGISSINTTIAIQLYNNGNGISLDENNTAHFYSTRSQNITTDANLVVYQTYTLSVDTILATTSGNAIDLTNNGVGIDVDVLGGSPITIATSVNDSSQSAILFTDISDSSVDEISADEGLNIYSLNGVCVVGGGFAVYYDSSFTNGLAIVGDGINSTIELFGSGTLQIVGTIIDIDATTSISIDAPTVQLGPLIGVNFTHTTIASASLLEPVSSFVTISGTAAIANINPPNGAGNILIAVASDLWTTTTDGNIATAVTAVVGEVYLFVNDGTLWDVLQTGSGGGSSFPSGITTDTIASYTADTAIDLTNGGYGILTGKISNTDGALTFVSSETVFTFENIGASEWLNLYVIGNYWNFSQSGASSGFQFSSAVDVVGNLTVADNIFAANIEVLSGSVETERLQVSHTSIASNATMAPTSSFVTISGTNNIETITPPSGSNILYIVASGAWSTTTGGNIASPTFTAVVNTLYTAVYDGTSWYIK